MTAAPATALSTGHPERRVKIIALLIMITGVVLAVFAHPVFMPFWSFTKDDIVRLFTQLSVIALVIERSLEVLLTPWRGQEGDELKARVRAAKAAASPAAEMTAIASRAHQHETRQLSFCAGLAIGITTSALGIRTLQVLVEPQHFERLGEWQTAGFVALDVLLTGALLAGGADGMHKLVTVFTTFMDKTAEKTANS
jgi:hypothetical protein